MRVLDGVHRVHAAVRLGRETIGAVFFEGSLDEGFALAVRSNVTHGLPLTLADREAAAMRLLVAFPEWSDRAIATNAGLCAGTVGSLRIAVGAGIQGARIGRDGRVRPVDQKLGRRRAGEFIEKNPHASLRQIALAAGISPNTARAVRSNLHSLAGAAPAELDEMRSFRAQPDTDKRELAPLPLEEPALILQQLRRDPSLRFNESGRSLLRWLGAKVIGTTKWLQMTGTIPPHARYTVASLARSCAWEWQHLAERLESSAEADL
jgi:hypothetical protein